MDSAGPCSMLWNKRGMVLEYNIRTKDRPATSGPGYTRFSEIQGRGSLQTSIPRQCAGPWNI